MSSKPSLRRNISSKSLLQNYERPLSDPSPDDDYSVGDDELHIEYYNVPRRLLFQGAVHRLLQFKFFPLLLLIVSALLLLIGLAAGLYLSVSESCRLDLHSYKDAWLFAVLAHWKSVLGPAKPEARFWHGCASGSSALFFHLFVGNILASVLLSSLAFNFQSISRRSISMFTTLTMGRRARIGSCATGNFWLSISIVERNEANYRKVSNVVANVFLFDPAEGTVKTIAINERIGDVFLPQELRIEIPFFAEKKIDRNCTICGKSCPDLIKHLNSMTDVQHRRSLSNNVQLATADILLLSSADIVRSLRSRQVQFIVILEGSDPITTDRVQVQKIFRNFELVAEKMGDDALSVVSTEWDGSINIDYKSFL